MDRVVLHVGMPKTGTTSLQSTLFWKEPDPKFRLITLDTFFGNRTLWASFSEGVDRTSRFFSATLPNWYLPRFRRESTAYLRKALQVCKRRQITPVLSAEEVWAFSKESLSSLKSFLEQEGFHVHVVGYIRPLVEFYQSTLQQVVKTGGVPIVDRFSYLESRYAEFLSLHREVFGTDHVHFYVFDPKVFPEGCVVKHFCKEIGLSLADTQVLRENEAVNINITKFLYAWNRVYLRHRFGFLTRIRRRLVLESLAGLPGGGLRFHPDFVDRVQDGVSEEFRQLRDSQGKEIPVTLSQKRGLDGLLNDSDWEVFSEESLCWLAEQTGTRVVSEAQVSQRVDRVVRQLNRLMWLRGWRVILRLFGNEVRLRIRRMQLKAFYRNT